MLSTHQTVKVALSLTEMPNHYQSVWLVTISSVIYYAIQIWANV